MWFIPCRVVSVFSDDFPPFVDVEFFDAAGTCWTVRDKLPVFRSGHGEDVIRVTLKRIERDESGVIYAVSTMYPDGVAALRGESEFVVRGLGFKAGPMTDWSWLARVPREAGFIDIDLLQHAIARSFDLLPRDTPFANAKHHYWSTGGLGDFTADLVWQLREQGVLEAEEDDPTRLRWVATVDSQPL